MHSANQLCRLQSTPARDFVPYLWKNVTLVVSCCLNYDNGSQQFFEVAMDLLQSMDRSHRETLDIEPYVREWSWLLLGHEHDEVGSFDYVIGTLAKCKQFVGRDSLDWIVFGLSSLLNSCFQMSRALGSPLHAR